MMFQGSGHIPDSVAGELLRAAGATNVNATTGLDDTHYFETVPTNALELALWQESDRMGFLLDALDQRQLSNTQSVVRNERRQRREVPPYALTDEAVFHELFPPEHPYHGYVIGSHADIQSAQLTDVQDFFKRYYVPNNASLAIVGDIDIAATKAMIEKYFGTIHRGAEVPSPKTVTPALTAEKRLTLTDQVQLPKVTMAWLTPPLFAPGDAEADVAAHLLAGGKASRMYEALVRRNPIAQGVTANQQSLSLGSVFTIEATAKPGHSADELEAAIQHELDALKADGPKPDELTAAKTAIRSARLFGLQDPNGVAYQYNRYNRYNRYTGDPGYLDKDLKRYADVQADSVTRFAVDQLRNDRRLVIHTVAGPKVLPPEPPTPPTPPDSGPGNPTPPSAEPWRGTAPQPGPAATAALPTAQRFKLANGLAVYLVESHTLPLAVASLQSRWGQAADPAGQPGLAGISVDMLGEGTQTRDAPGIAREIDALGATLTHWVTDDGNSVSVSALTPQMSQAMAVMSDVVRAPAFPPGEVDRVRQQRLVSLRQQADQPDAIADKVMRRAVYGENHPYGHPASEQALRAISRDDLVRFHQQAFSPHNSALVLAGDVTVEQARKLAEDTFGGWTGTGADTAAPGPPVANTDRVLVVDRPGATQTTLALAQPGVARSDPDYEKLQVLDRALSTRININLRELHGYTYGASSHLGLNRGVSTISLRTSAQTQFTGPSVQEMLNEATGIQNAPVSDEELARAKQWLIRSLPASFSTATDSAAVIGRLYLFDLPPDYYQALPARLAKINADEVQAVARTRLRPGEMKVIAVGDRSQIDSQLAVLNLGPIAPRRADGSPPL